VTLPSGAGVFSVADALTSTLSSGFGSGGQFAMDWVFPWALQSLPSSFGHPQQISIHSKFVSGRLRG
jgi:hypothetical protein